MLIDRPEEQRTLFKEISLKRLSVQFRGMGAPEKEIKVTGTVREARDGRVVIDTVAEQEGSQIIRNAEAELEILK